jgi:hypothetical protein
MPSDLSIGRASRLTNSFEKDDVPLHHVRWRHNGVTSAPKTCTEPERSL